MNHKHIWWTHSLRPQNLQGVGCSSSFLVWHVSSKLTYLEEKGRSLDHVLGNSGTPGLSEDCRATRPFSPPDSLLGSPWVPPCCCVYFVSLCTLQDYIYQLSCTLLIVSAAHGSHCVSFLFPFRHRPQSVRSKSIWKTPCGLYLRSTEFTTGLRETFWSGWLKNIIS